MLALDGMSEIDHFARPAWRTPRRIFAVMRPDGLYLNLDDERKEFLFEAITLATIGGAVGIFLAWVVGKIVTATFFPTYLSILAVLGALAASGGVGILSGIVPAWKAARLDPIEALRYE